MYGKFVFISFAVIGGLRPSAYLRQRNVERVTLGLACVNDFWWGSPLRLLALTNFGGADPCACLRQPILEGLTLALAGVNQFGWD